MRRLFCGSGVLFAALFTIGTARADDWVLRVDTSSRACRIELATAAAIGLQLAGPFSSRADACNAASKYYDSSMSDTSKCWAYVSQTVDWCSKEGVNLPH
ncbi:MAG TPA: hypothetical protein VGG57_11790 [Stellaceae bacterium]|jgi:hypothetical protein